MAKSKTTTNNQSLLAELVVTVFVILVVIIIVSFSSQKSLNQPTPTPSSEQSLFPITQDTYAVAKNDLSSLLIRTVNPPDDYQSNNMPGWSDPDDNGCDTRNDILARDLINDKLDDGGCKFLEGDLIDPYTNEDIHFIYGENSTQVQIDHLVAKEDAWNSGGHLWSSDEWRLFINDPEELLAVSGKANQSKGSKTANEWLPPNQNFWCQYIILQIAVKAKYSLSVTQLEKEAMADVLDYSCNVVE
jgi:hypothetical protein